MQADDDAPPRAVDVRVRALRQKNLARHAVVRHRLDGNDAKLRDRLHVRREGRSELVGLGREAGYDLSGVLGA